MSSQMQVLLTEDVDHLGYEGDLVDVKKGYWRNYLRPQGKATGVTKGMVKDLTDRMERRRAADVRNKDEATELRAMLSRTTIEVAAVAGPQGKLFGSVGNDDIAKALEAKRRMKIDPKKLILDDALKALGTYMVPIHLYEGIRAELTVVVVAKEVKEEDLPEVEEAAAEETSDDAAEATDAEATAEDADEAATEDAEQE